MSMSKLTNTTKLRSQKVMQQGRGKKMYKAGGQWVAASLMATALMLGGTVVNQKVASADDTVTTEPVSNSVDPSSTADSVVLSSAIASDGTSETSSANSSAASVAPDSSAASVVPVSDASSAAYSVASAASSLDPASSEIASDAESSATSSVASSAASSAEPASSAAVVATHSLSASVTSLSAVQQTTASKVSFITFTQSGNFKKGDVLTFTYNYADFAGPQSYDQPAYATVTTTPDVTTVNGLKQGTYDITYTFTDDVYAQVSIYLTPRMGDTSLNSWSNLDTTTNVASTTVNTTLNGTELDNTKVNMDFAGVAFKEASSFWRGTSSENALQAVVSADGTVIRNGVVSVTFRYILDLLNQTNLAPYEKLTSDFVFKINGSSNVSYGATTSSLGIPDWLTISTEGNSMVYTIATGVSIQDVANFKGFFYTEWYPIDPLLNAGKTQFVNQQYSGTINGQTVSSVFTNDVTGPTRFSMLANLGLSNSVNDMPSVITSVKTVDQEANEISQAGPHALYKLGEMVISNVALQNDEGSIATTTINFVNTNIWAHYTGVQTITGMKYTFILADGSIVTVVGDGTIQSLDLDSRLGQTIQSVIISGRPTTTASWALMGIMYGTMGLIDENNAGSLTYKQIVTAHDGSLALNSGGASLKKDILTSVTMTVSNFTEYNWISNAVINSGQRITGFVDASFSSLGLGLDTSNSTMVKYLVSKGVGLTFTIIAAKGSHFAPLSDSTYTSSFNEPEYDYELSDDQKTLIITFKKGTIVDDIGSNPLSWYFPIVIDNDVDPGQQIASPTMMFTWTKTDIITGASTKFVTSVDENGNTSATLIPTSGQLLATVAAPAGYYQQSSIEGSNDKLVQASVGTINLDTNNTLTLSDILYDGLNQDIPNTLTTLKLTDDKNQLSVHLTAPIQVNDVAGNPIVGDTITYLDDNGNATTYDKARTVQIGGVAIAQSKVAKIVATVALDNPNKTVTAGKTLNVTWTSTPLDASGNALSTNLTQSSTIQAVRNVTDTWTMVAVDANGNLIAHNFGDPIVVSGQAGTSYANPMTTIPDGYKLLYYYNGNTDSTTTGANMVFTENVSSTTGIVGTTYYAFVTPDVQTVTVSENGAGSKGVDNINGVTDASVNTTVVTATPGYYYSSVGDLPAGINVQLSTDGKTATITGTFDNTNNAGDTDSAPQAVVLNTTPSVQTQTVTIILPNTTVPTILTADSATGTNFSVIDLSRYAQPKYTMYIDGVAATSISAETTDATNNGNSATDSVVQNHTVTFAPSATTVSYVDKDGNKLLPDGEANEVEMPGVSLIDKYTEESEEQQANGSWVITYHKTPTFIRIFTNNLDGTTPYEQLDGNQVDQPDVPVKDGYTSTIVQNPMGMWDITYTQVYKVVQVNFVDGDNSVVGTASVKVDADGTVVDVPDGYAIDKTITDDQGTYTGFDASTTITSFDDVVDVPVTKIQSSVATDTDEPSVSADDYYKQVQVNFVDKDNDVVGTTNVKVYADGAVVNAPDGYAIDKSVTDDQGTYTGYDASTTITSFDDTVNVPVTKIKSSVVTDTDEPSVSADDYYKQVQVNFVDKDNNVVGTTTITVDADGTEVNAPDGYAIDKTITNDQGTYTAYETSTIITSFDDVVDVPVTKIQSSVATDAEKPSVSADDYYKQVQVNFVDRDNNVVGTTTITVDADGTIVNAPDGYAIDKSVTDDQGTYTGFDAGTTITSFDDTVNVPVTKIQSSVVTDTDAPSVSTSDYYKQVKVDFVDKDGNVVDTTTVKVGFDGAIVNAPEGYAIGKSVTGDQGTYTEFGSTTFITDDNDKVNVLVTPVVFDEAVVENEPVYMKTDVVENTPVYVKTDMVENEPFVINTDNQGTTTTTNPIVTTPKVVKTVDDKVAKTVVPTQNINSKPDDTATIKVAGLVQTNVALLANTGSSMKSSWAPLVGLLLSLIGLLGAVKKRRSDKSGQ